VDFPFERRNNKIMWAENEKLKILRALHMAKEKVRFFPGTARIARNAVHQPHRRSTKRFLLAAYLVLKYPYWLNILY
jgi:hypothetical protein